MTEKYTLEFTARDDDGNITSMYERAYIGKSEESSADFANEAMGNDVFNWLAPSDVDSVTVRIKSIG